MKKAVILFCVPFLFVSCDDLFKTNVQVKFDHKTFIEQRQLWQDSNVKNYQYELSCIGFAFYYGTIFVENGNFKDDLPSDEHEEYIDIAYFIEYSTIDEIYKTIEDRFNYYNNTKQSINDFYYTEILVEYDKTNHFPCEINYKYHTPPATAVDGTFHYEIANFNKLD